MAVEWRSSWEARGERSRAFISVMSLHSRPPGREVCDAGYGSVDSHVAALDTAADGLACFMVFDIGLGNRLGKQGDMPETFKLKGEAFDARWKIASWRHLRG